MKPYYQDDYTVIYNNNCVDVLGEIKNVDLFLTDPPYGIGEANGKNKSRGKFAISKDYGVSDWDNQTIDIETINDFIKLSKKSVIFGGNYYNLPPSPCWFVWDKVNGATDFADCELAWTNLKMAVRMYKHMWHGMLRKGKEERFHPTQKPLDLMKWCILKADKEGFSDLILDPFMGSGTTLLAAKQLNRKAIGIEKNKNYCDVAIKRLSQGVLSF